jgi:hypothetical protein
MNSASATSPGTHSCDGLGTVRARCGCKQLAMIDTDVEGVFSQLQSASCCFSCCFAAALRLSALQFADGYKYLTCRACGDGSCEMLCRHPGCRVASHARCFTIDQDRWPSVIGGHNGVTLRSRGGCLRYMGAMGLRASWRRRVPVSSDGGKSGRVGARASVFLVLLQERGGYGQQHLLSCGAHSSWRIRKFESEMGLLARPQCCSPIATRRRRWAGS